jgi:hypothetical protein
MNELMERLKMRISLTVDESNGRPGTNCFRQGAILGAYLTFGNADSAELVDGFKDTDFHSLDF